MSDLRTDLEKIVLDGRKLSTLHGRAKALTSIIALINERLQDRYDEGLSDGLARKENYLSPQEAYEKAKMAAATEINKEDDSDIFEALRTAFGIQGAHFPGL